MLALGKTYLGSPVEWLNVNNCRFYKCKLSASTYCTQFNRNEVAFSFLAATAVLQGPELLVLSMGRYGTVWDGMGWRLIKTVARKSSA